MKNAEGKVIDFSPAFTLCCMSKVGQPAKDTVRSRLERYEGGAVEGAVFLALHRKRIVCWSFFTEWIIILIWVQEEEEWQFMERADSTAPYII